MDEEITKKTLPVRSNRKRQIIIVALSIIFVLVIIIILLNVFSPKPDEVVENIEQVEISNNIMDENETKEISIKGEEIIASGPDGPSLAVDYYYGLIKNELDKNEIIRAFQTIWVGHDNLLNSGNSKFVIELLTKVDVSEFDISQKYSIYQAIVDASETIGDETTKSKYAELAAEAKAESDAAFEASLKASEASY